MGLPGVRFFQPHCRVFMKRNARTSTVLVLMLAASPGCRNAVESTGHDIPSPRLRIVSGNDQLSLARRALPQQIVVQTLSVSGDAEPLAPVTFAVASGGGYLSLSTAITSVTKNADASGIASVPWVVGAAIGPSVHQVVVNRPGIEGTVTFAASGIRRARSTDQSRSHR